MALSLQDRLPIFEKVFQTGVTASDGPAALEAADLLLTMLPLFKDMISWAVKGMFPRYLPYVQNLMAISHQSLRWLWQEVILGLIGMLSVCCMYLLCR